MSSKISVEQLNANTAAYAIDDFRKMVNYENLKYRDPLGSQKIFLTDTERNPALSNEFRDLARACVTAACETKAFRGLVKQIDNDLKANA